MRILIATGVYPPESGGPATYSRFLAERLPGKGIGVSVLPFREVRHLPKVLRHIAYFFACVRRLRDTQVLFAQDTVSVGFPASLAAWVCRVPFVVRVPGDHAWEQARQRFGVVDELDEFQTKHYGVRTEALRFVQRFVVRRARYVVVPSKYMQTIVSRWADPQKIVVIYSSVSQPVIAEAPLQRPEGFLVVTVARLVPWKGVDGLVRVVGRERSWQLVVVDDGPERGRLYELAVHLGVEARVHFVGRLPHPQAMGWVQAADVFALNSTYEGLSHLLVEALSLGTPIVATAVGGNPELIESCGLLVEPKNDEALHRAIKNVETDRVGASGRVAQGLVRAKLFDIETAIGQIAQLLRSI